MNRLALRVGVVVSVTLLGAGLAACIDTVSSSGCTGAACLDATVLPDGSTPGRDAAPDAPADVEVPDAAAPLVVGPQGGTVVGPFGIVLEFPPGAVDKETTLTIRPPTRAALTFVESGTGDAGVPPPGALSSVYNFEPQGLVFARPVRISAPLPSGVANADWYWRRSPAAAAVAGDGHDNVGAALVDGRVVAEIVHFGQGYVGVAAPKRTVVGSRVVTRVGAASFTNEPQDLSGKVFVAWTGDFDAGAASHAGAGYVDGTFRIPDVPDGPFLFQEGTSFVATASALDLGYADARRAGLEDGGAVTETTLSVTATGLHPWSSDFDRLQLVSPQTGTFFPDNSRFSGLPGEGATALSGTTVDVSGEPRIDGTKGDVAYVTQEIDLASDGGIGGHRVIAKVLDVPKTTVVAAGGATEISGAFREVALDQNLSATFDVEAIRSVGAKFGPSTTWQRAQVDVVGLFGPSVHGLYESGVPFLTASVGSQLFEAEGATLIGPLAYGQPFPGWSRYGRIHLGFGRSYAHPMSGLSASVEVGYDLVEETSKLSGVTLGAQIEPPSAPVFNGFDLTMEHYNTGLTGVLQWTKPAGAPHYYVVRLYRLDTTLGQSEVVGAEAALVASIRTTATAIFVPPGLLENEKFYFVTLDAVYDSLPDAVRCTKRKGTHHVTSTSASELFAGFVTPV